MKKVLFSFVVFILISCTPQVTVPSQVTVTLVPPTSIPTPTLHPEFIAWQELISSSGRYTLTSDGFIQNNGIVINGLQVDSNGTMTLTVNNEKVILTTSDITFSEDGIKTKDYELQNGEWVEAVNIEKAATEVLDQYGVDPASYTLSEVDGVVSVTDNETGTVLLQSNEKGIKYSIEFAVDTIAKSSCEPTEFKPNHNGLMPGGSQIDLAKTSRYFTSLFRDSGLQGWIDITQQYFLIDREKQCWGKFFQTNFEDAQKDKVMIYRDGEGVVHVVTLLDEITWDEIYAFAGDR